MGLPWLTFYKASLGPNELFLACGQTCTSTVTSDFFVINIIQYYHTSMAAILNFGVNMNSNLKSNYFSGFVMTALVKKDISFVFLAYVVTEIIHFEKCLLHSAAILFFAKYKVKN